MEVPEKPKNRNTIKATQNKSKQRQTHKRYKLSAFSLSSIEGKKNQDQNFPPNPHITYIDLNHWILVTLLLQCAHCRPSVSFVLNSLSVKI